MTGAARADSKTKESAGVVGYCRLAKLPFYDRENRGAKQKVRRLREQLLDPGGLTGIDGLLCDLRLCFVPISELIEDRIFKAAGLLHEWRIKWAEMQAPCDELHLFCASAIY